MHASVDKTQTSDLWYKIVNLYATKRLDLLADLETAESKISSYCMSQHLVFLNPEFLIIYT